MSYYHDFNTPKNWICTCLVNVCQFIKRGKSPKYSQVEEIPVIAQKCNQKNGILSLEKALFVDPSTLNSYTSERFILEHDILVNSTGGGTVGRVAIVENELFCDYKKIVTDSHVTTIRLLEKINPFYVYFFLKAPIIFDHVEEKCDGSTNQIELNAKTIMSYPLPLPPAEEQNRIVSKIDRLFDCL